MSPTTKATRSTSALKALSRMAQMARTHAGDLRATGRSRQARDFEEAADYLEGLVNLFRADGRGLPVQRGLFD